MDATAESSGAVRRELLGRRELEGARDVEHHALYRDTLRAARSSSTRTASPTASSRTPAACSRGSRSEAGFTRDEKLDALEAMLGRYVEAGLDRGRRSRRQRRVDRPLSRAPRARQAPAARRDDLAAGRGQAFRARSCKTSRPHDFTTGSGDDWLSFGAYKVTLDGGMTIGTAYQRRPYGPFGKPALRHDESRQHRHALRRSRRSCSPSSAPPVTAAGSSPPTLREAARSTPSST